MTDEYRRFDIEPKTGIPTLDQWGIYKRQAAVYARAVREQYRNSLPLPPGDYILAPYSEFDAALTMEWWRKFHGQPVLVNRLRAKNDQIVYLNDMIRPETLARMAPVRRLPWWQGWVMV